MPHYEKLVQLIMQMTGCTYETARVIVCIAADQSGGNNPDWEEKYRDDIIKWYPEWA